jgi:hypothetical protein
MTRRPMSKQALWPIQNRYVLCGWRYIVSVWYPPWMVQSSSIYQSRKGRDLACRKFNHYCMYDHLHCGNTMWLQYVARGVHGGLRRVIQCRVTLLLISGHLHFSLNKSPTQLYDPILFSACSLALLFDSNDRRKKIELNWIIRWTLKVDWRSKKKKRNPCLDNGYWTGLNFCTTWFF